MSIGLTTEERRFFRDQLRDARAAALLDAEGFHPIVAALERLGSALNPKGNNLGKYRDALLAIARRAHAAPVTADDRGSVMPLEVLFTALKNGRNDAVHQGAHARHLVKHCIEFALLVEKGLMADSRCVADLMVRDPVCAEPWQQVAVARQRMLTGSFSCLPIRMNDEWKMLSDHAVATYLATSENPQGALRERIETAALRGKLNLSAARTLNPDISVREAVEACVDAPVLIVQNGHLLGIASAFDFL